MPREHRAVADDRLAVSENLAAIAQIADEVPVQRRVVGATCLRIRAPECEVNRSRHLLVEQDVAGGAIDARVGPDPELAEVAGAAVGGERLLEIVAAALGAGLDDLA